MIYSYITITQFINNKTPYISQLAYLNTNEEAGLLQLTVDQIQMISEEQIAKLTLTQSQFAQLGNIILGNY